MTTLTTNTKSATTKGRPEIQLSAEIETTFRATYDGSAACVRRLGQRYDVSDSTIRAWAQRLQLTKRSRLRPQSNPIVPTSYHIIMQGEGEGASRPTGTGISVDVLQAYLRDMERYPRLSAEEEIQLGKRAAQGDQTAKHALILANLRLVMRIAKYYTTKPHGSLEFLDLIQEGTFGLMHAVDIFDVTRGWRFSTVASWWIRQAISRTVQDKSRTIRIPFGAHEQLSDLYKLQRDADEELTVETMAERLSMNKERVQELLVMSQETQSLDAPLFGAKDDLDIGSILALESEATSPQDYLEHLDLHQQLLNLLHTLQPRDRLIITLRYGLDGQGERSLEVVSKTLGISRERIRQIEVRVLRQLRQEAQRIQLQDYLSA
jgi:RNA polymerase primary sigma factor